METLATVATEVSSKMTLREGTSRIRAELKLERTHNQNFGSSVTDVLSLSNDPLRDAVGWLSLVQQEAFVCTPLLPINAFDKGPQSTR
jgi:hypothetical protein